MCGAKDVQWGSRDHGGYKTKKQSKKKGVGLNKAVPRENVTWCQGGSDVRNRPAGLGEGNLLSLAAGGFGGQNTTPLFSLSLASQVPVTWGRGKAEPQRPVLGVVYLRGRLEAPARAPPAAGSASGVR